MKKFLIPFLLAASAIPSFAQAYPDIYLRGGSVGWEQCDPAYQFSREGNTYTLHVDKLDGEFKFADRAWDKADLGASLQGSAITGSTTVPIHWGGANFQAANLSDVTLSFTFDPQYYPYMDFVSNLTVTCGQTIDPIDPPVDPPVIDPQPVAGLSGTLPVLYINVYTDASHSSYNNEIISMNLDHKNYFTFAEYYLDTNNCEWLKQLGATDLGSKEEPLPLQIKARGNWTRTGFSKKPFKLKLDKKASMLGMTKSKHYAILAHADDDTGYLKNFTGFNLGKRMGLPWTPGMQPVEVVINGDYRGLYFLTESIRVEEERVNITELADNETDGALASGGYLVELDNYDEENQIRMEERGCAYTPYRDMLRITFDTPEEYSPIQRQFVGEQFSAMNNAVGNNSDELWRYMDIDDAARYYVVEEIISHYEAYHGSTYLFRDFGEGEKWHFSPLWDCGNAFRGPTDDFFYNHGPYGNTWIASMRCNEKFNRKVEETWKWFMSNKFDGIYQEIDEFASRVKAAAEADYKRWNGQPVPYNGQGVADNRNMEEKANFVKGHLSSKINWLKGRFGDYNGNYQEPERDRTDAMPLPDYVKPATDPIDPIDPIDPEEPVEPIEPDNSPAVYIRGELNGWGVGEQYRLTKNGNVYSIHLNEINGDFKFGTEDWKAIDFGGLESFTVSKNSNYPMIRTGRNLRADHLRDVTFSFKYEEGMTQTILYVEGEVIDDPIPVADGTSGTLPVLHINVYTDADHTALNNEIISYDLDHKDYFKYADYYLDVNGCEWLQELGATDLGSAEAPLALQIKARGNWTRTGFSKKPFKLKLDKKASMLGMTKSKHYAILAHADDETGYLKNFTGFNLGKRMGLPWTPGMQPVEVIINGNYRGLYFLTESIRVEEERVNIKELADEETDSHLISGGYLVELDNYDEENQIRMEERWCVDAPFHDILRITYDTPEVYSELQHQFVYDQFSAMNELVGMNNDELWRYLDIDDAARYYLVEEIISHYEAYHGSTYLFRDYGEDQKWHFSPLWDCGNAFRGPTNDFFYNHGMWGNTWIASMRANSTFNAKIEETWKWFMSNNFEGIYDEIDTFARRVKAAAEADYKRWHNEPTPNGGQGVEDNRDMENKANYVKNHLAQKINWLKERFGNYSAEVFPEPERDVTPAMPLPEYATTEVSIIPSEVATDGSARYFNLQGIEVKNPSNGIFIKVIGEKAEKVIL